MQKASRKYIKRPDKRDGWCWYHNAEQSHNKRIKAKQDTFVNRDIPAQVYRHLLFSLLVSVIFDPPEVEGNINIVLKAHISEETEKVDVFLLFE